MWDLICRAPLLRLLVENKRGCDAHLDFRLRRKALLVASSKLLVTVLLDTSPTTLSRSLLGALNARSRVGRTVGAGPCPSCAVTARNKGDSACEAFPVR